MGTFRATIRVSFDPHSTDPLFASVMAALHQEGFLIVEGIRLTHWSLSFNASNKNEAARLLPQIAEHFYDPKTETYELISLREIE